MNKSEEKYNGWTNYATWRIQLEIVSDYIEQSSAEDFIFWGTQDMSLPSLADHLKETVEEVIGEQVNENTLAYQYAMAFVDDVNFYELAEHARTRIVEKLAEEEA